MIIKRGIVERINRLLSMFPAVLIAGARQTGKTTLVRNFLKGSYFDLERQSDAQVFAGDAESALRSLKGPLIIDEAHNMPEIFSALRSVIDDSRKSFGRFILLGSVNPLLIKTVSESLAGRIGIAELTPFMLSEMPSDFDIGELWLRGGYPDAALESDPENRLLWLENYIATFVERDTARMGLNLSPPESRKFLMMLAACQGQTVSSSELGRAMSVSYHTINKYLDILESCFLIRRLPPFHANIKKRLVKSSKLYIRDTGILHALLGIKSSDVLAVSPKRGFSWEGFVIEQITALERLRNAGSAFYFFRTQAGAEIDLIIDRGSSSEGFEIKLASSVTKADWLNLERAVSDKICGSGRIIYAGGRSFSPAPGIEVTPASVYLRGLEEGR
jgi:predicted AAA+ superfamily ATPase